MYDWCYYGYDDALIVIDGVNESLNGTTSDDYEVNGVN